MNKQTIVFVAVGLLIGLTAGFFIGQEYTKQKIVKSIDNAISSIGSNTNPAEESGEIAKALEKKRDINVAIGEMVELATFKYVVNSVEEKDMIKSEYGQPHLATEGTKFVIVNLTATNTKTEAFDYDASSPILEDKSGNFYKTYSDTIGNVKDYMNYRELSPNIPQTGVIVFQVPESTDSYELVTAKANSNDLYRVKLK